MFSCGVRRVDELGVTHGRVARRPREDLRASALSKTATLKFEPTLARAHDEPHVFGRQRGEARSLYPLGARVFDVQVTLRLDAHAEPRERFGVKLSKGSRGKRFVEARRAL